MAFTFAQLLSQWTSIFRDDAPAGALQPSVDLETRTDLLDTLEAEFALKAPLLNPHFTGVPTVPNADVSTNTEQIASTKFAQMLIGAALTGVFKYAGTWNVSTNLYPAINTVTGGGVLAGNVFQVTVAGTKDGITYALEDTIMAEVDSPGQTAANWRRYNYNAAQATNTIPGLVALADNAITATGTNNQKAVTPASAKANYMPLGGGTFTGPVNLPNLAGDAPGSSAANKAFVLANAGGTSSLTNGEVFANSSAPYALLSFGINNTSGSGNVRVPDPAGMPVGYFIYLKTGNVTTLRSYDNTAKLSLGAINSFASSIVLPYNQTYRLVHLGNGVWQVEYVNGGAYSINGMLASSQGQFTTAVINNTTVPLSSSVLSATYSYMSYGQGTRVYCRNITSGALVYERATGGDDWMSHPITVVS